MSKYADIIERLEKATGPSEELSAHIKCALLAPEGSYVEQSKFNGAWCVHEIGYGGKSRLFEYPRVPSEIRLGKLTASLDASIALVELMLPGCEYTLRKHVSEGFNASVNFVGTNGVWIFSASDSNSMNLATALLIAMFRALEAQEVQP